MNTTITRIAGLLPLLIIGLLMGLTHLPVGAQAQPEILDCQVVATNDYPAYDPAVAIDEGVIAWEMGAGANRELVYATIDDVKDIWYVLQQPVLEMNGNPVNTLPTNVKLVNIDNGYIAYTGRDAGNRLQMYLYSIELKRSLHLSTYTAAIRDAAFVDGLVVWVQPHSYFDDQGSVTVDRIWFYDIDTETRLVMRPANSRYDERLPRISGDTIAYEWKAEGTDAWYQSIHNVKTGVNRIIDGDLRQYDVKNDWLFQVSYLGELRAKSLVDVAAPVQVFNSSLLYFSDYRHQFASDGSTVVWGEGSSSSNQMPALKLQALANGQPQQLNNMMDFAHVNRTGLVDLNMEGNLVAWEAQSSLGSSSWQTVQVYDHVSQSLWSLDWHDSARPFELEYDIDGTYLAVAQEVTSNEQVELTVYNCNSTTPAQSPQINAQPQSVTAPSDETVTLTIDVTGSQPLSYQWYQGQKGDTSIPVGNPDTTLEVLAPQFVTSYWVRVSNPWGTVDSEAATVLPANDNTSNPLLTDGFENGLTLWTLRNPSGDRIRCNRDTDGDGTVDKVFAATGNCAFMFRGHTGENSSLHTVLLPNATVAGDTLVFTGSFNVRQSEPNARVKMVVRYNDGTPATRMVIPLAQTEGYQPVTGTATLASGDIRRINVVISNRSTSGRMLVDDIEVRFYRQASATTGVSTATDVLPLPPAPEFSSGN